jgi:D-alanyl-D-alanine carboxypeptidase (penicillin-binding protein 5/6)
MQSGLPGTGHYSTTSDLTKLAIALVRDFPEYLRYTTSAAIRMPVLQSNRNSLLGRDPRVDGLKTGHTENAGFV